jgi:two-component system response regulator QseB
MRLLLVEDDSMIGTSLVRGLGDDGYAVDWVRDAAAAATALEDPQAAYALVLLDRGLPDGDGLFLLKSLRQRDDALPVLVITARDALDDRIAGLDTGADDYLVKPFDLAELKARIRSLLRRRAGRARPELICGHLVLNPATREVRLCSERVVLTAREFTLLHTLMDRPGMVLSRRQLEERLYAWHETVDSNAVEFIIHGVRRKLGASVIENVRGLGWRLGVPA